MPTKEQIMVECIEKNCRLHWIKLCTRVPFITNMSLPKIIIKDLGSCKAGTATCEKVTFNINFAMTVSYDKFDITVIHELCHTYAMRINYYCKSHGDLWKFLFNTVMGIERGQYHNYCPTAAQIYRSKKSLLKTQKKLIAKIKLLENK